MPRGIRIATATDESAIVEFFTTMLEHHGDDEGPHAVRAVQGLLDAIFTRGADQPTVFAYDAGDGDLQGIAALREPDEAGAAELITVQVFNTVQGRGIGQTLLRRAIDHVRQAGALSLHTEVLSADVRSRGFLRREGFVVEDVAGESAAPSAVVRYVMTWPAPAA